MSHPQSNSSTLNRLIVIAGPTAAGKTALALDLAERVDGEVINADALQLYRGMDIGTAKLPVEQRRGIPHHLFDTLEITETATVADYQARARAQTADILERGRTPILVGGSGLYLQSVVDELEFPGTDPQVRAELEAELAEVGARALHGRLTTVDPVAAANIEPLNGRKVVRALEVLRVTGRPFSAYLPVRGPFRYDALWFCVDRDTAVLDERIDARVHLMVAEGLLEEVRQLDARGLRQGVTASRALGYQQMLDVIDGTSTVEEAIALTISGTRRYVRRQRSWFRRDQRQIWLDAAEPGLVDRIVGLAADRPS